MTRQRPPYLMKETNRHGSTVWYFRKRPGPRIRIRGEYGSAEFMAAYHAAMAGEVPVETRKSVVGKETLAGLIGLYRQSGAWMSLSEMTRRQRDNIFDRVIAKSGDMPYSAIRKSNIAAGRDARSSTPFAANNYLKAMRKLFAWAAESGLIDDDPTLGVKSIPVKTEGFHEWSEDEVAAFEQRWPIGTRERLALAILLYAGFRRGDAYALGRQHIRNGVIYVRTEKKGVPVALPVHPDLKMIIDATPTGTLAFIAKKNGEPMNKFSFGNWFRKACNAAGVPGSAHGLRKAAAIRWAHAGATERQLMAWFGWTDPKMAAHYTRRANSERLARDMFNNLTVNETGLAMPAPGNRLPAPKK